MQSFRLVLLDHAKLQLDKPIVKKILADLIVSKQKNFERTDDNYITLDKHDMLGSHVLIYDTSEIYEPKLIFTVRVTYQDRAEVSKIKTPVQELYPELNDGCKKALDQFLVRFPSLVECNSLFMEPGYSVGRTGINFTDIGFVVACTQLLSRGYNYFVGCPNAKFKTQRFVEPFGSFPQDHVFVHPKIPDPHMLVLLEEFKMEHIWSVYKKHQALLDSMCWVTPENIVSKKFSEAIQTAVLNSTKELAAS